MAEITGNNRVVAWQSEFSEKSAVLHGRVKIQYSTVQYMHGRVKRQW